MIGLEARRAEGTEQIAILCAENQVIRLGRNTKEMREEKPRTHQWERLGSLLSKCGKDFPWGHISGRALCHAQLFDRLICY